MVGFEGDTPSDHIIRLIQEYQIGGIILFGRNVQTPAQVWELIQQLQENRDVQPYAPTNLPLLIAIDQEGGIVTRLARGFTIFPGNMALGAVDSEELTRQASEVMARELAAVGIHMNLAPVLDINTCKGNPVIGVRAYGDNPQLVARLGAVTIKTYQQCGIIATAKHFPGIGEAEVDAHLDLPSVLQPRQRLEKIELYPFMVGIQAGVKAIMTSHVCFPALESEGEKGKGKGVRGKTKGKKEFAFRLSPFALLPATFSQTITETLLRKELGFEGLIITDDLEMGAILNHFNLSETVVRAVEAGADLLLICRNHQRQIEGLEGLYQAVEEGRITADRISTSFQRILRLKQEFCMNAEGKMRNDEFRMPFSIQRSAFNVHDEVGTIENRRIASEVARRAVTLVRDRAGLIPLNVPPYHHLVVFYPQIFSLTQVEEGYEPVTLLTELRKHYPDTVGFEFDTEPSPDQIQEAYSIGKKADFIVIGSYNSHLKPLQQQLIRRLITLQKPIIFMALRNPYDISEFPEIGTCLALYDYHKASIRAGIQVLSGDAQAEGKLPVKL